MIKKKDILFGAQFIVSEPEKSKETIAICRKSQDKKHIAISVADIEIYHDDLAKYANSVQLCNNHLENNIISQDEFNAEMADIKKNQHSIFISEHSIYYLFEWLECSDENLFGKYKEQINETLNDITENIGDSVKIKEVRRLLNEATKLLSAT